jgi:protoporphyrin/coproporphyrin ferrochelatase
MSRVAIVLFNLGGPDSAAAVEPFLFNLFADPAIIALPNPLRWALAKFIARRRAPIARKIFARLGNVSPLRANTEAQAQALEQRLGAGFRCFIAMRYWSPTSAAAAAAVKAWGAEEIVLLPFYPQFSSTTTASSMVAWREAAAAIGLQARTRAACCYPTESGFIAALVAGLRRAIDAWPKSLPLRVLLSAHGLPQRVIARGDPYQWQVEATAAAVRAALDRPGIECVVCFQSRVGPLAWLEPATDGEIRRAGSAGIGLIVQPIAFVSEHSETLVELDIEYGHLAQSVGVPRYERLPTVGTGPAFIDGLVRLVEAVRASDATLYPEGGRRRCPAGFTLCPCLAA